MKGKLAVRTDLSALLSLQKKSPALFHEAMKIGAIQLLTWCNVGSSKESRKPPIRFGVLRGSSSAFVGNELVQVFPQSIKAGAKESPSPATAHNAKKLTITVVYNTNYAARMHEGQYNPGEVSAQDGDAGNKWVEKHLEADKEILMALIAKEFKKRAGT